MRFTLQFKLTLVSLLLLFIPAVGFHVSSIIKTNLLKNREETLMFSAKAVASALSGRQGLFAQELFQSLDENQDIYLYELTSSMRLNGKLDDWQPQLDNAIKYSFEHQIFPDTPSTFTSLHFRHMVGKRQGYLYALFIVTDDTLVFRKKNSLYLDRSDHLQISLETPDEELKKYIITTEESGWVNGFLVPSKPEDIFFAENEPRIQGVWQETEEGYIIELRLPMKMLGKKLAFAIADVDDPETGKIEAIISTTNPEKSEDLGWLLSISDEIVQILKSMNKPNSRIQVVDMSKRIRASIGELSSKETDDEDSDVILPWLRRALHPIIKVFLEPVPTNFSTDTKQLGTLEIEGVEEAFSGKETLTRYRLADSEVEIMAAIAPLFEKKDVIGAVVVEQTTNSILALKNRVIEESIIVSLLTLLFSSLGLLLFASRLSARIKKLRNQAANAIGKNGQLQGTIEPVKANDEIGDLSATLSNLLEQLKQQVQYKEKMADNLEHEIRTPLAGISAALKNISQELETPSDTIQNYINWALSDAKRLEILLSAIRDATNLAQALQHDQHQIFNLKEALQVWLQHGWQLSFPETRFTVILPDDPLHINGDPARIKQMLDKLVENGISFMREDTAIEISLARQQDNIKLSVTNQGANIPEENIVQLFNSMVSLRDKSTSGPHLGLGLYIVRIIAEHHKGSDSVENIVGEEESGVTFSILLPYTPPPAS